MGQRGPAGLLDAVKKSEICAILASGGSQADAAGYVGCSPGTISNTAKRDPAFAADMHRARAMCTADCLAQIHQAGAKSWRAAAWILERTRPEQYEKINLRQASTKQLNGFWRTCGDELLAGLPPEQQELLQKRFKQVAKSYASRAFGDHGMEEEGGKVECRLPNDEVMDEVAVEEESVELMPVAIAPRQDHVEVAAQPAGRSWQIAAAAVLLVAAMLWGSFARPAANAPSARRVRGLACSGSSTTHTSYQDQTSTPARACRVLNDNLERFPPSASQFAFKVSSKQPAKGTIPRHLLPSSFHPPGNCLAD